MFFYKRPIKEEGKEAVTIVQDCLNPSYIIRGVANGEGLVLLLNDGHEESRYTKPPKYNKEGKQISDGVKSREYLISEIYLDKEDAERFRKLYEVEDYTEYDHAIHSEGEMQLD